MFSVSIQAFHTTIGIVRRTNGQSLQRLLAESQSSHARQPHLYPLFDLSQVMAALLGAEQNNDSTSISINSGLLMHGIALNASYSSRPCDNRQPSDHHHVTSIFKLPP
jgi:hypothetical protein